MIVLVLSHPLSRVPHVACVVPIPLGCIAMMGVVTSICCPALVLVTLVVLVPMYRVTMVLHVTSLPAMLVPVVIVSVVSRPQLLFS